MNSKKIKKLKKESNFESKKEFIIQKIANYFNPQFIDINNQKVTKKFPWLKIFGWLSFVIVVILMITTIKPDFQNWNKFWEQIGFFFKINKKAEIGSAFFTPLETFIRGLEFLWTTISYSILGTIFGILIAVPLALLSSKNFIKNKFIYIPFRILMSVVRAIPPVVFAFAFFFLLSPSLAAMFSIMVFVSSLMTKWLYEDLDTYDMNSYQGTIAIGNTKALAFKSSVLPYLMKRIVSYGFYSFEMVIRFAAILSIVGIPTIGQLLSDQYALPDNYSHMSIVLWTLIVAMIIIESLNFLIKKYILDYTQKHPKINDSLPYEKQLEQLKKQKSKIYIFKIFITILIIGLLLGSLTQIEWAIGNQIKIDQFKVGIKKLFNPDWSLFQITDWSGTKTSVIPLGVEAFLVAIASSIIGLFFALILGILAAKNITKWFSYPFKLIIIVIRAIPAFTFAALFLILSKDSKLFVGVLSLGIHSIGMLGKLVMESVEKIPKKTFEALDAAGANWFQKIKFVVFKSIMPQALSNFLYRIEINFKSTVVIGAVGASDFGFQISTYSTQTDNWDKLASYLIFTIIVLLILEQISDLLRSKLMTGYFFNQDIWFKKLINKNKLTRSLALSIVNKEEFRSDIRFANYMIAKLQYDKLFVFKYQIKNKILPNNKTLQQLKLDYKNYLEAYAKEIKRINKEIKLLYNSVYKQTMLNQKDTKNWFKKNKVARKSANIAIDKYFENNTIAKINSMNLVNKFAKFWRYIEDAKKITLCTHIEPDGDTLGSAVALKKLILLNTKNKEVRISGADYPRNLLFLIDDKQGSLVDEQFFSESLKIVVDTSTKKRIYDQRVNTKEALKIDHHPQEHEWLFEIGGDYWPATGQLITRLAKELNLKVNEEILEALGVAIITDTEFFKERNVNFETFMCMQYLLDNNLNYAGLLKKMQLNNEELNFIFKSINHKQVNGIVSYLIVHDVVSNDIARPLVAKFVELSNTEVSLVLLKTANDEFRCEIRSKSNYDVSKVASHFLGGGHFNSAGFIQKDLMSLNKVISYINKQKTKN
ncbi:Hypothetical protein, predicted transmembrane protein [Metamycoplasma auris 15026]|uniref:ABC transmembrane type-1 domain-containing protein n=1 Tax=Metamycoplasma auris 15026 TaxID=1188233 RepID=N9UZP2_9BACT|nr:ABC transporter permease subunit [Metamycoplasma auris]ENY68642.1 Hypothetical protein, predicted transmembrane protein [Metamycoplasma auris 15026]